MDARDFEYFLLKEKQQKFLEYVERSANFLKVDIPKVKFWECPKKKVNEVAHIHLPDGFICVSDSILKSMDFDDIKETASHEVTHLLNESHDWNFQSLDIDTKSSLCEFEGVTHISDTPNNFKSDTYDPEFLELVFSSIKKSSRNKKK